MIVVGWQLIAMAATRLHLVTTYDSFRDMAYSHAILRGELGRDPVLPGLAAWYPPAGPILFAAMARLTGWSVPVAYATSIYWLNWLIPVSIYLVARSTWGRAVALWSLPMVGLGSLWWSTHGALPITSIQGVALGLLALRLWMRAELASWPWALAAGLAAAVALVFHPICGGLAVLAVVVHGLLLAMSPGRGRPGVPARQALIVVAVSAACSLPVLAPILAGPVLNEAPRHWFAPELHDVRYALQAHVPVVPVLGLLGMWLSIRDRERAGWVAAYAAAALLGTAAGYLAHDLGWPIPYLIPHEFQWHLQLALCITAAAALPGAADALRKLVTDHEDRRGFASVVLALLAVGPSLWSVRGAYASMIRLDDPSFGPAALARWCTERGYSSGILAAEPEVCFYLSGLCGIRAQLVPAGHMNPRVAWEPRAEDMRTLLTTRSESTLSSVLQRVPVDYLLQIPRDSSQYALLVHRYDTWSVLDRVPLPDSTLFMYRVQATRGRGSD